MKNTKKLLSIIFAIVILFTTSSFTSVGFGATGDAYIKNEKYYHYSFGDYQECYLNYIEMIETIQKDVLKYTATVETYHYFYAVERSGDVLDDQTEITKAQRKIEKQIERSIFTHNDNNPKLGEYLYDSGQIYCSANYRTNSYDVECENGKSYDVYGITIEAEHLLTAAEEDYISKFAEVFSETYIAEKSTDYDKVKTIYDFVIRNSAYDHELFVDKSNGNNYPNSSDRFRISHSAYGAIMGNRLTYDPNNKSSLKDSSNINLLYNQYSDSEDKAEFIDLQVRADFEKYFGYKIAVNDEKIVELKSINHHVIKNGLAVCEGYSKLFYYLCEYNGITARIVDGDYVEYISNDKNEIQSLYGNLTSGKASDPHEWNYVLLDDNTGKGNQWFIVDTTWGSQRSIPDIDYNNYDYFLIGTKYTPDEIINPSFSVVNHQQPYVENGPIPQLYNWYENENKASDIDYDIKLIDLGAFEFNDNDSVIIERKTDYSGVEKCAYILQGKNNAVKITLDEDSTILSNTEGFDYNGKNNSEYMLIIPYLTGYEYQSPVLTGISKAGKYTISSKGMIVDGSPTTFSVDFNIMSVDMSNESSYYPGSTIQNEASYTGKRIIPEATIIDGYKNTLTSQDYDIEVFQNGKKTDLIDIGTYNIVIKFKGNYSGEYNFLFTIGKIDLSQITMEYKFPYLPKYFMNKREISSAADFFNNVSNISVGDCLIYKDVDFIVTSTGKLGNYNDEGKLTFVGKDGSKKVQSGSKLTCAYKINEKFNIKTFKDSETNKSFFEGQAADSNSKNIYTYDGKAKKPTVFDNLDKYLEKGKDYEIVSYSNNINAGKANVKIKGINGCEGEVTMYFIINPANIATAKVTTSYTNSKLSAKISWNGTVLEEGKDYTLTITKQSSTVYILTIKGINNFGGTLKINTTIQDQTTNYIKPTADGKNKVKLSKTSYVYSGSACKPTVTFVNGKGQKVDSRYYTVKYSNNKNVGTGKVTLTFRNGYSGSVTATFTINPKATKLSSLSALKKGFKVKWKKQATQTTGYQIQIATNSKFTKGVKTYEITKNSTTSAKITKLTAKKKYYVRIRTYKTVSGKKYYSSWSASKPVTTKK